MINLRGLSAYFENDKNKGDIEIQFIGLQKGEKLMKNYIIINKQKKLCILKYIKSMILKSN